MDIRYKQTNEIVDIMRIARASGYLWGRWGIDRSKDIEDYTQIAAIALWEKSDMLENEAYAYKVAKYAIFNSYDSSLALKRKANHGVLIGSPGESDSSSDVTSEDIKNALEDKHRHWLNDVLIRDELEYILSNEEFLPDEARIIEALLRGDSPSDISSEYRMSSDKVCSLLKKTVKRIRKKLGVNAINIDLSVIYDQSKDVVVNRPPKKDSIRKFGGDEGRLDEEGDFYRNDRLLKGGLDGGGLNIDINIEAWSKKQEEKKQEKKKISAYKKWEIINGIEKKIQDKKKKNKPKYHHPGRGARKSLAFGPKPAYVGKGVNGGKQEDSDSHEEGEKSCQAA